MDRKQQSPPQHQVFINFRGVEVRYNFISHLEKALRDHAINVFIDTNEDKGEDISNLFKRIEESRIALVVFSERYTESRWCLEELAVIKKRLDEGRIKVLPIFYNVITSDVKQLKGYFGEEFLERRWDWDYRHEKYKIEIWKKALECISGIVGLTLDTKSPETDFILSIVTTVLKLLEKVSSIEQTAKSQANQHFQKGETTNSEKSIFRAPQEKSKKTEPRESTGFGPRPRVSSLANPGNTLAPFPIASRLGRVPFGQYTWSSSGSGTPDSSSAPNANFPELASLPLQGPIRSTSPDGWTAVSARVGAPPVQGPYKMGQRARSTHQVPFSPDPSWLPNNHNPQYGHRRVLYSSSTSIDGHLVSNYRFVSNPSPHFSIAEIFHDDSDQENDP